MPKILKIEVEKDDKKSIRYVLHLGSEDPKNGIAGLDVTRTIDEDNREDTEDGFIRDTGRAFAHSVHRMIQYGYIYEQALQAWSRETTDPSSRPEINIAGFWRNYRRDCVLILREWVMDRTFS